MRLIIVLLLASMLIGCETTKCVLGVSTEELEALRPQATVKVVNAGLDAAYNKALAVLKENGSYVYKQDKDMIAVYRSQQDTTSVGIFFKEIDKNTTQIEVSSPSSVVKEAVAEEIYAAFGG